MTETRKIFIKSLISGLKIDVEENPFEYQAVVDGVEFIKEADFMDFYNGCRKRNTYGDGVKAIIETAEQFKPIGIDLTEIKAKELIGLVESINTKIGKEAIQMGQGFEYLVSIVKLPGVSESDMAILNQVKPYSDHKQLIINIRLYTTSVEQLKAFIRAIEYSNSYVGAIENSQVRKMIKGRGN